MKATEDEDMAKVKLEKNGIFKTFKQVVGHLMNG
jgi:hypothetical protein